MLMLDEAALHSEIALGNQEAFREFFDNHRTKLYNYLYTVVKSKEIAEEIVIDVFLKLWTGRELITEIQNMDAFLHKVAYNKALDFFRIASRNAILQKFVRREMEALREKQSDNKLQEWECKDIINKALERLSPRRRVIFTLNRIDGLSYDEIAEKLQLSRNTVRNTMAETLRSLRSYFRENEINSYLVILFLLNN